MIVVVVALVACTSSEAPEADLAVYDTVVKGDTLSGIAKRHGVSVDALRAANGIASDRIEVGQRLVIPAGSSPTRRPTRASTPAPASKPAALTLPREKPCLPPPDVTADEGMAASAGLSYDQVKSSLDAFVPHTLRCVPEGGIAASLDLRVTVACTGRVARVEVADRGAAPAEVADCVADTLRYAPFPAHDIPDGFAFDYPLTFTTGG